MGQEGNGAAGLLPLGRAGDFTAASVSLEVMKTPGVCG